MIKLSNSNVPKRGVLLYGQFCLDKTADHISGMEWTYAKAQLSIWSQQNLGHNLMDHLVKMQRGSRRGRGGERGRLERRRRPMSVLRRRRQNGLRLKERREGWNRWHNRMSGDPGWYCNSRIIWHYKVRHFTIMHSVVRQRFKRSQRESIYLIKPMWNISTSSNRQIKTLNKTGNLAGWRRRCQMGRNRYNAGEGREGVDRKQSDE